MTRSITTQPLAPSPQPSNETSPAKSRSGFWHYGDTSAELRIAELSYQFPSRVERVPEIVDTLLEPAVLSPSDEHDLRTALRELLLNAIEHGNFEVGFVRKARAVDDGSWERLLQERSRTQPYCDRSVIVRSRWQHGRVTFVIGDEGSGFGSVPPDDPMEAARLSRNHGMGMTRIRTSVDELAFNEAGNEVTIAKRLGLPVEP